MRKHLTLLFAALGFVAIYGLVATSDIDDLEITAQAVRAQADYLQYMVETNDAYREFYTRNPVGGL